MNAFSLMMSLCDQGADFNAMLKAWMDLSEEKGWPATEEGLRRYLARVSENGAYPKMRSSSSGKRRPSPPPPADFVEWWKHHPDYGFGNDGFEREVKVAFRCQRYRSEWESSRRLAA